MQVALLQTLNSEPKYFAIAEYRTSTKSLALSTDTPESSPADTVPKQNRDEWAETVSGYIERSLLIVVGASVTVVAGFLSQVWSSASVAFRTDLATNLKALGTLFVATFVLPTLRFFVELHRDDDPKKSRQTFIVWVIAAALMFFFYTRLIDQLGDIVLKYARVTG